jgi:uncharacterized protein (DUF1499 family)
MFRFRKVPDADRLGVRDGRLAPCPSTPNCVSSQATDREHTIEPFIYESSLAEAKTRLKRVLAGRPRTRLIAETENYLRYEFTTRYWRFVDDAEFYFDDDAKCVHVRSASRVGRSDYRVNRKRVEKIRARFLAAGNLPGGQ